MQPFLKTLRDIFCLGLVALLASLLILEIEAANSSDRYGYIKTVLVAVMEASPLLLGIFISFAVSLLIFHWCLAKSKLSLLVMGAVAAMWIVLLPIISFLRLVVIYIYIFYHYRPKKL